MKNSSVRQGKRPRRPLQISPADLPDESLVGMDIVCAVSGLGTSYIYELTKQGRFPPVIKLSERCARRRMRELRRWLADPVNYRVEVSV